MQERLIQEVIFAESVWKAKLFAMPASWDAVACVGILYLILMSFYLIKLFMKMSLYHDGIIMTPAGRLNSMR